MFTIQHHSSQRLVRRFMERTRVCFMRFRNAFNHKIFPEFLHPGISENDELPRTYSSALSHSTDSGIGVDPVLSCENVGDDESDALDEEDVVDKPGTTIGT